VTAEALADDGALEIVARRVVEVDGIPMSVYTPAAEPRAVVVALHGGAASARYFDLPGRPRLSLVRIGAALGFTMLALDRPGYGVSGPHAGAFDSPQRRVDAGYGVIEELLGSRPRGAGVFLLAHSAGCELAVRMAADARGADLLGVELAGIGLRQYPEAIESLEQMRRTRSTAAIRELLWYPPQSYPPEIVGGRPIGFPGPSYEAAVVREWETALRDLAGSITVPVRFSHGEYERVWRADPEALAELRELFDATPRFVAHTQAGSGHNLSVGYAAAAYHLSVLSFVEECALPRSATP
jgi:pimeloyl-ACP methyl ester carboxylesterase